ncbi:MAG: hypothetical protein WCE62_20920, partial [Polyangiales bacterium]
TVLKGSPDTTTFEIRLGDSGVPQTNIYLWVGTGGAKCDQLAERNLTQGNCAELAGNPWSVGTNSLVGGGDPPLTLQTLLDAQAGTKPIVSCDSSGLKGTPYKLFAFRNTPPSENVDVSGFGAAEFYIDVQAPAAPLVDTSPQEASTFLITWANPNPPDDIAAWRVWVSDIDDPSTAIARDDYLQLTAREVRLSASQVGLQSPGDTAYVFMQAYDQAYVSDVLGGNQSELSPGVEVTFVATAGFCDATGSCSGCAAAPMAMAPDGPSSMAWVLGVLCALGYVRRRHR